MSKKREVAGSRPFLFRYLEREDRARVRVAGRGAAASNPKEEAPRPEPTRPGPWGD